jgi:hypothetical protein
MYLTRFRFFLLGVILLFYVGCGQRYWYRLKLDGTSVKRYTIKVDIVNHTPELLTPDFETLLKRGALKELKKYGYYESPKDSPDYFLVLQLAVDSFNMALFREQTKIAIYSDSIVKSPEAYRFNRTVRAILMQCDLLQRKPFLHAWTGYDDVYYFDDFRRDVGRCESVLRFVIRQREEKRKLK